MWPVLLVIVEVEILARVQTKHKGPTKFHIEEEKRRGVKILHEHVKGSGEGMGREGTKGRRERERREQEKRMRRG